MKHFSLVLIAALLLTATAFAQIIIHDNDFSAAGYSYTWGMAASTSISAGSSGANQTWNFGNFLWTVLEQRSYVDPTTTPFGSNFPTSTRAEHIEPIIGGEAESYSYYRIVPDSLIQLGQAANNVTIPYTPPMVQAPLPMTYEHSWIAVQQWSIHMTDTIYQTYTDSLVCHTDGWGTITTPFGSWQALRAFQHHWVTSGFTGHLTTYQFVQYNWVNQAGNSVVVLSSGMNDVDPNFSVGSVGMLGIPLAAEPAGGPVAQSFVVRQNFPNPFNPTTEIPVTLSKNGRVSVDVFDDLGQLVTREERDLPAGDHRFMVDGSRWAAGLYFARVSAGGDQRVLKMNLMK